MTGALIISLDFELLWGVRDHETRESYGRNVLGGREAIPQILDLFAAHGIRATWATVGFLFAETRDELMASLPDEDLRPRYRDPGLSGYGYLDEVGQDERDDPYSFGLSLIRRIASTPGQEIGTHTMSHLYALEPGMSAQAFEADLRAALALAAGKGLRLGSIVFPRNQYAPGHLAICKRLGIGIFRGNPAAWPYRATPGTGQTLTRRGLRLVDAHTGLLGAHLHAPEAGTDDLPKNVPASHFLRPRAGRLARLHPLHVVTLKRAMTAAAKQHKAFHLWWHPHNFGRNTEENLLVLKELVTHHARLRDAHGMTSHSMETWA